MRAGVMLATAALAAAWAAPASAAPATGPHETLDYAFTAAQPGVATGASFRGTYHAAGDPSGDPPYMRSMTFHHPSGFAFDSGAMPKCTASDAQLALFGPSACPAGSQVGAGTATGKFMGQTTTLDVSSFNNTDEQVMVAQSPFVATVMRGHIDPDASITFSSPTCYSAIPGIQCPVDDVLQMGSAVSSPVHGGYMTTPPTCPEAGFWETPISFVWADGTQESVVTQQACTP